MAVYIKRVQLTHFKSFGGDTDVALLPGFTVVTGPNGSGKSNILDGLMFALGLSSSKGMRADRLPDLVNQGQARSKGTVETSVTATFDLTDWQPESYDQAPSTEAHEAQVSAETSELMADIAALMAPDPTPEPKSESAPEAVPARRMAQSESPEVLLNAKAVRPGLSEWCVTRRLRVTAQGTYTSTYYINGEACTLTELHEQLAQLRIYPDGYNIVLQGDVTGIISMNSRERREIIDELAGVAQFDRKIHQAKDKLDAVREREERCEIVGQELQNQLNRLAQDRLKAEKYQRLRQELQEKERWEKVMVWEAGCKQAEGLRVAIAAGDRKRISLTEQTVALDAKLQETQIQLDELNQRVKALGEADLLAAQASLATQEAELRQVVRQRQELAQASQTNQAQLAQLQRDLAALEAQLRSVQTEQIPAQAKTVAQAQADRDASQSALAQLRDAAYSIAAESQAWVQQQQQQRQQLDAILATLEPQRSEQAQLRERSQQLDRQIQDQASSQGQIEAELASQEQQVAQAKGERDRLSDQVAIAAAALADAEQNHQVQRETQQRLQREQIDKQRQLDKLDSMTQAMQETQGTQASRLILQSGIDGVHGVVAQLGQVEPRYQLALEIAAGARLGQIVVNDDRVAAAAIALLKRERGGRATFLPMNKIRPVSLANLAKWKSPAGFVDHAANLIDCDDRYRTIFSYIFGSTLVFEDLRSAQAFLGQYRMVTLEGELLEASGAMTGGSLGRRQGMLTFGQTQGGDSDEQQQIKERLTQLETILARCEVTLAEAVSRSKTCTLDLTEFRQQHREQTLQLEQLQQSLSRLRQQRDQITTTLTQNRSFIAAASQRLAALDVLLPQQDAQVTQLRQQLGDLETSELHGEWQQRQALVQQQEQQLQQQDNHLRSAQTQLQTLTNQLQRNQEQLQTQTQRQTELTHQAQTQQTQTQALATQNSDLDRQIQQTRESMASLEQKLGSEKVERDRTEQQLRDQQSQRQQLTWQLEKLDETQANQKEQLTQLDLDLATQQAELPAPLPEIPEETRTEGVLALQQEIRTLAKRIQAMEPVNMLALEEYERTQVRLDELTQKIETLQSERTELLLRIETFTTLRQRAFLEAYDAVNLNFRDIFAQLSDGDGYLELENPESPLDGGLNLVAHPKGKPVRRLASMSGGEKSLTALSFIFALQRYRPSPFYSFDEVDSFLDGANVERLAKIVRQQSGEAQFIVVSHRRPMIEMAQRTIGVTQARGAHTQVVGITLEAQETPLSV